MSWALIATFKLPPQQGHTLAAEDQPEAVGVLRLNPRLGSCGEEPFESFVPESCDRHKTSVTHMVTKCSPG